VPVDFEAGSSWLERLTAEGFDADQPAIVASTGVSTEILTLAREAGFREVQHVSAATLTERYFRARTDGLRPPNNSEELLVART
jgi:O-methyltransferase involved in polyketide biosynthesis